MRTVLLDGEVIGTLVEDIETLTKDQLLDAIEGAYGGHHAVLRTPQGEHCLFYPDCFDFIDD
jgi:hypothetical protein